MIKPISPAEVPAAQLASLPDAVIQAWNQAIVAHWDGKEAVIPSGAIWERLKEIELGSRVPDRWLDGKLLNLVYSAVGWNLTMQSNGHGTITYFVFTANKPL